MNCGIVIGSYHHPSAVALNVACIRRLHGNDIPILISDDCSPSTCQERLRGIAETYTNVTLRTNPKRLGLDGYNAAGDASAFHEGLLWAKSLGLQTLCKLSQRLIVWGDQYKDWLTIWSEKMLARGLPAASRYCREGPHAFPLRSECVIMDVDKWTQTEVLSEMEPVSGRGGEGHLMAVIRRFWEGQYLDLRIFGVNRWTPVSGILWHCVNSERAYRQLAERTGVVWQSSPVPSWRTCPRPAHDLHSGLL